jgi:AcrR family transcriptional regulator
MPAATARAAQRRAEQREALLNLAERTMAAEGPAKLHARALAQELGIALGAIYNLVDDLDELVLLVIERTLHRLDGELEAASLEVAGQQPATRLQAMAVAYCRFARDNPRLWRAAFDYHSPTGRIMPGIDAQQTRMFRHILEPLDALLPAQSLEERLMFAQTLFTATHGVVQLSLEERLFAVPPAAVEEQLRRLVSAICKGL